MLPVARSDAVERDIDPDICGRYRARDAELAPEGAFAAFTTLAATARGEIDVRRNPRNRRARARSSALRRGDLSAASGIHRAGERVGSRGLRAGRARSGGLVGALGP